MAASSSTGDSTGRLPGAGTMELLASPTLQNEHVRLEPLRRAHSGELALAVEDGELWRTWYTSVPAPEQMAAFVERRLAQRRTGEILTWTIVLTATGRVVGTTAFLHIDAHSPRVEIGGTWLAASVQGTGVNAAAKLLLLERAFTHLGCIAVEFRTHSRNLRSRAAIERLGAKRDGVLRNHIVLPNGTIRDTVVYSVIDAEWPAVRLGLQERLRAGIGRDDRTLHGPPHPGCALVS